MGDSHYLAAAAARNNLCHRASRTCRARGTRDCRFAECRRGRDALWQDPDWLEFAGEWGHLIEKRQTNILLAARFSPLR